MAFHGEIRVPKTNRLIELKIKDVVINIEYIFISQAIHPSIFILLVDQVVPDFNYGVIKVHMAIS